MISWNCDLGEEGTSDLNSLLEKRRLFFFILIFNFLGFLSMKYCQYWHSPLDRKSKKSKRVGPYMFLQNLVAFDSCSPNRVSMVFDIFLDHLLQNEMVSGSGWSEFRVSPLSIGSL